MTTTIRSEECKGNRATLYVALELSERRWHVAMSTGVAQRARLRSVAARDVRGLESELARGKRRFGLPEDAAVASCYEAGRDAFWVHRWLVGHGIDNQVVDSSSIEVSRRQRRAKTDRLDAEKLLALLLRARGGEPQVWRVVRVPRSEDEDARHAVRELDAWKSERKRVMNRMRGLLATQGLGGPIGAHFEVRLAALRAADSGEPLGAHLQARLEREWAHLLWVREMIRRLEQDRRARMQTARDERVMAVARQLMRLAGIAEQSATVLSAELFSWRAFRSGREVGGFLGLTGTPYDSGGRRREQGISKAGNPRLRQLLVQLAWVWRRCQRESALAQWYERRFGGSPRQRKVGIVALARRLAIALWRFVEWGEVPEGARLSTPTAA